MKSRLVAGIISFCVWMLLGWPADMQHAVVGIVVAALVAGLTGDMFTRSPAALRAAGAPLGGSPAAFRITRYLWFGYYVPLFLWEFFKANIDIAVRVLNPGLPINPGIVKVTTTLKSDTALMFLANSITLTPGTFCVDIKPEEGILYIHWIDVKSKDTTTATQLIVNKFERVLKKIFD